MYKKVLQVKGLAQVQVQDSLAVCEALVRVRVHPCPFSCRGVSVRVILLADARSRLSPHSFSKRRLTRNALERSTPTGGKGKKPDCPSLYTVTSVTCVRREPDLCHGTQCSYKIGSIKMRLGSIRSALSWMCVHAGCVPKRAVTWFGPWSSSWTSSPWMLVNQRVEESLRERPNRKTEDRQDNPPTLGPAAGQRQDEDSCSTRTGLAVGCGESRS